jgi:CheY-like chemotaxis protein
MPNLKILITDDSKPARLLIRRILEKKNVEITEAVEGAEALEHALQEDYDLIFMDHNMPKMTGLEFVKVLNKYNKKQPVIMTTAVNASDTIKDSIESGVADYLIKPFTANSLLKKTDMVLSRFGKKLEDK